MQQFAYWGPTKIRRHRTQFRRQSEMAPRICAQLKQETSGRRRRLLSAGMCRSWPDIWEQPVATVFRNSGTYVPDCMVSQQMHSYRHAELTTQNYVQLAKQSVKGQDSHKSSWNKHTPNFTSSFRRALLQSITFISRLNALDFYRG